jgi:DNA-binding transcriptional MerR regulator
LEKAADAFRTISEVAGDLELPQHVLRFWESRFPQIRPMKRAGGRRYYRPDDVDLLRGIRHLLYGEGYTIRGVQRILREHGLKFVQTVWQPGATQPAPPSTEDLLPEDQEPRVAVDVVPNVLGMQRVPMARAEPDLGVPPTGNGATGPAGALPTEYVRKLRAALDELGECRRIVDAALQSEAA